MKMQHKECKKPVYSLRIETHQNHFKITDWVYCLTCKKPVRLEDIELFGADKDKVVAYSRLRKEDPKLA